MITKAEIRLVRSLGDRAARQESGLFVAEGEKLVREVASSGWRVHRLWAVRPMEGLRAEPVSPAEMERMSRLRTPPACLAVVEMPRRRFDERTAARELVLALDGVQDPGNVGTIVRLADWFGIGRIVCSADTADCFNPKAVQASMGAVLRVEVHYAEDLAALLERASATGVPVWGTFLEGEDIYAAPLAAAGVLVLGSEGRGISPAVAETVTHRLFVPPYPVGRHGSESLNVAMAAAVACAEFRRRLR